MKDDTTTEEKKAEDTKTKEEEMMALFHEFADKIVEAAPTLAEIIMPRVANIEVELKHKLIRINFK